MKNIICLLFTILAIHMNIAAQHPTPECMALINSCGEDIVEFAKRLVSPPEPDCKQWNGSCDAEGEIWREGKVSIGTSHNYTSTNGFSPNLTVKGGIISEQLQICRAAWCDYVFEDTFQLMPLKSVDAFIRKNGHLPDCTPGIQLETMNGFFLDEQTVQQQQKIEESFLHLIQIGERIDALEARYTKATMDRPSQVLPLCDPGPEFTDIHNTTLPPAVVCFVIQSATSSSNADGMIGIRISSLSGPFSISWFSGKLLNVNCDGLVRIPNLLPGTYTFTVKNVQGQIIGSCTSTITVSPTSLCDLFYEEACKEELLGILETIFAPYMPDCKQWDGGACDKDGLISRKGNVAIGTSIGKSGYSLAVAGGIMTDNFRIQLCSGAWCDYVFEPDYVLKPLPELKTHLAKNKHLPGMLSQTEITREGGYELKRVKLDQQEKIEESYLHLIHLKKKINQLNQSLENLN